MNKIYLIRGEKVMLDRDLAALYGVETKVLKQAVRRNIKRFPQDFMFEMTKAELENWRSQIVTSNSTRMGLRYLPFCFTEQGVTMLSCVLNSDRAVEVNIRIVRIFVGMRKMLLTHQDLLLKMEQFEKRLTDQDAKVKLLFDYLRQFIKEQEEPRTRVGFKV
ncbi:MAG: ORF6N domain-containing protein [Flavobacteriales bacterium]|nr:ORF6N domain-containing protein [Flavobacteriales bacterium]